MSFAPAAQLIVDADGSSRRVDGHGSVACVQDPPQALADFVREPDPLAKAGSAPRTVGFLSYELGPFFERRLAARSSHASPWPLAWLGRYEAVATFLSGNQEGDAPCTLRIEASRREAGEALLEALGPTPDEQTTGPETGRLLESPQWGEYSQAVARAQDYIRAGDIYQVNLARRFRVSSPLPPWEVYLRLRATQPVPHGSYIDIGAVSLLSNSPERFLRVSHEAIRTEPIKGTRRRDPNPEVDERLANQLLRDPKERAEHVMIVDLERNDLGRLCEKGSIEVSSLLRLETFATLHHLVSTIDGRLTPKNDLESILRATFPGGSITGTPKIRATEIIAELEPGGRGPYTGAIVWLRGEKEFDSSIAIRTAVAHRGVYSYHAGGGIVADSDASREYAECWLKARAFLNALLGRTATDALLREAQTLPDRPTQSAGNGDQPVDTPR